MRYLAVLGVLLAFSALVSWNTARYDTGDLRAVYSGPVEEWPAPDVDADIPWEELGPLPDNPYRGVDSLQAKVDLGRQLFFDPRLSASGQISCSSCHDPQLGWSNGRTVGLGHDQQEGPRNAPSLLNAWAARSLFWDGRAQTLEDQVVSPITNPVEMHQDTEQLPLKIRTVSGYREQFREVFGDSTVTLARISEALAAFERIITSKKSPFDRFMEGQRDALSDRALLGLHLFRTKARCMNCHYGPFFTDHDFHNLGLHYFGRDKYEDWGRYHVTGDTADIGKFKTPSLRDVAFTGPWMHNGLFWNLKGVINLYDHGGSRPKPRPHVADDPRFPETSERLKPLSLTAEEKNALIAFLESVSRIPYRMPRPELPGM